VKATINIEYTGEELEKFAMNLLSRGLTKFVGEFTPEQTQFFFAGVRQALDMFLGQAGQQRGRVGGGLRPNGAPPQPFGGPVPHADPFGSPPPGRGFNPFARRVEGEPDNVQPIHGEPPHVDRCFPVEATRQNEAGIACCQCATANGTQRTHCRNCGHKLCVIATPPPAPAEPSGTPE
jgi:hypothetical protein